MEYLVTEKYLNDGRVIASARQYHGEEFTDFEDTARADIYRTVVDSFSDAQKLVKDAKAA